ncbi:chemotaxis protein CheB [Noviherbaspirillum sp.]|uniref:chemotaxis protein CheB n=1 Tax=Noviherbaspirillum sp. TaxID=1926288 RepID=UPI002D681448|nr:chemotaxis protein CheB [Noviherbaspirillum sp.]HZW20824.1 chemotaxis protein CheB [Noviherbaspirillum sp.]
MANTTSSIDAVVIGASAGGVEALLHVLGALPADFQAAVLVVMHLAPDRPSIMPRLLAQRCAMSVKEADDKEEIRAGTVYLAVPDYHLLVEPEKRLALSRDEPVHYSRPSIDVLFESAAYAYCSRLLAIVLTGASNDGADGLRAVRAAGGAAWVQDPSEATVDIMPAAALAQAGADRVLTLSEIAAGLAAIATQQER